MKTVLTIINLINVVMVMTFSMGCFVTFFEVTGPAFVKFSIKLVFGIGGLLLPILYFLKYFSLV